MHSCSQTKSLFRVAKDPRQHQGPSGSTTVQSGWSKHVTHRREKGKESLLLEGNSLSPSQTLIGSQDLEQTQNEK